MRLHILFVKPLLGVGHVQMVSLMVQRSSVRQILTFKRSFVEMIM